MIELPYLTSGLPGIGGRIKDTAEDFVVEEVPLYPACGEGTHVYFRVRKVGVPTPAAIARIARHMQVAPGQIGFAGLKDARAVTTQMMSLEHADAAKLADYRDGQVEVTWTSHHTNKLRAGHLAGNRFTIRIRGVGAAQLSAAGAVLDVLRRRGVPNFFDRQRFGARSDTADLGKALVAGDLDEFVALLLGRPRPGDPPDCKAAREAFDAGRHERALRCWPRHYANERRVLAAFRKKRSARQAVAAADRRMKRLYVSAYQSAIFNEVLVSRLETLDRILDGDMACKHENGAFFRVTDAAAEQPRADAFQISPTGPIPGYRSNLADGKPGQIERDVLAARGVDLEAFRNLGALKAKGTRRCLRFRLGEPDLSAGKDTRGEFVELAFTAGAGSYATVALREIMKQPPAAGAEG